MWIFNKQISGISYLTNKVDWIFEINDSFKMFTVTNFFSKYFKTRQRKKFFKLFMKSIFDI